MPSAPQANPTGVVPRLRESKIENRKSKIDRLRAYRLLWALALGVFVLDQVTKIWINARMPLGTYGPPGAITVIDGFFHLVHVGNTGAAWSLFTGRSAWLAGLALVTLTAIYFWRHSLGLRDRIVQISFGLLCGGIVGNLVDRLLHGHVIDFLDFHFGDYIYPTFNVADAGICVGVGVYLIYSLKQPGPDKSQTPNLQIPDKSQSSGTRKS